MKNVSQVALLVLMGLFTVRCGVKLPDAETIVPSPEPSPSSVVEKLIGTKIRGRYVFYNNSRFFTNAGVEGSIAPDKEMLLPGQTASFKNYTSYVRGINGMVIDFEGPVPGDLDKSDFVFSVGNDNSPKAWRSAEDAFKVSITKLKGGALGGGDRLLLTWPDGSIRLTWLRVEILANARTGLIKSDIFYFGNSPGETGDSTADALVTSADDLAVRARLNQTADLTSPYDFDRSGTISTWDAGLARQFLSPPNPSINLIYVPY